MFKMKAALISLGSRSSLMILKEMQGYFEKVGPDGSKSVTDALVFNPEKVY